MSKKEITQVAPPKKKRELGCNNNDNNDDNKSDCCCRSYSSLVFHNACIISVILSVYAFTGFIVDLAGRYCFNASANDSQITPVLQDIVHNHYHFSQYCNHVGGGDGVFCQNAFVQSLFYALQDKCALITISMTLLCLVFSVMQMQMQMQQQQPQQQQPQQQQPQQQQQQQQQVSVFK